MRAENDFLKTMASEGACRTADPDLFHPVTPADQALALGICGDCSVKRECLDYALETRQAEGIWGGTIPEERRLMWRNEAPKQSRRGRRPLTPDARRQQIIKNAGSQIIQ